MFFICSVPNKPPSPIGVVPCNISFPKRVLTNPLLTTLRILGRFFTGNPTRIPVNPVPIALVNGSVSCGSIRNLSGPIPTADNGFIARSPPLTPRTSATGPRTAEYPRTPNSVITSSVNTLATLSLPVLIATSLASLAI